MLPDKVRVDFEYREAVSITHILDCSINHLNFDDKKDRPKILVMSLLSEVSYRLQLATMRPKEKYKLHLTLAQAQALVIAYEKKYLKATDEWEQVVLMQKCNYLHQKTA